MADIARDDLSPADADVEGHKLAANDNETIVVDDEADTEGHRLASNDNETIVVDRAR